MDPIGIDKAVDEVTTKALPEVIGAMNAALDRLEKLLDRLDGATMTFRLGGKK